MLRPKDFQDDTWGHLWILNLHNDLGIRSLWWHEEETVTFERRKMSGKFVDRLWTEIVNWKSQSKHKSDSVGLLRKNEFSHSKWKHKYEISCIKKSGVRLKNWQNFRTCWETFVKLVPTDPQFTRDYTENAELIWMENWQKWWWIL